MITMSTLAKLQNSIGALEWLNVESCIMHEAFKHVAPKSDWRGPIDATVDVDAIGMSPEVIARSVAYMTSTEASLEEDARGTVRVRAAGYRAGPAGP